MIVAMTTERLATDVLERAGLPAGEVSGWVAALPASEPAFDQAAAAVSAFLARGQVLLRRLPEPRRRTDAESAAAHVITAAAHAARDAFLARHTAALYEAVTGGRGKPLRVEQLITEVGRLVPGLVPGEAELAAEAARPLPDKEGAELAHGLLLSHVLAQPQAGRHLIGAMLRPLPEALGRLPELRATGTVDLGPVLVTRHGRAGVLELRNPRYLNAEDDVTLRPSECAVDLILLDPGIEVGVIRGGVIRHARYQGERVFGAGLNLTRLYQGHIGYLFFMLRDLGFVNKIYRGIARPGLAGEPLAGEPLAGEPLAGEPWDPADLGGEPATIEKLWLAAVERFAVGGACQLLHVVDHVIAARGSRMFLPARKEGIIPGASNLRLPRFVGDRAARQAILSGREWTAGDADAAALCDEVVDPAAMDSAVSARIGAITSSGLVNAAANRRALRVGAEPVDVFREYMAAFAIDQAHCYLSPALVRNLQAHWQARDRAG
jgi:enoyl-CoA hydratase/carnithine racemase